MTMKKGSGYYITIHGCRDMNYESIIKRLNDLEAKLKQFILYSKDNAAALVEEYASRYNFIAVELDDREVVHYSYENALVSIRELVYNLLAVAETRDKAEKVAEIVITYVEVFDLRYKHVEIDRVVDIRVNRVVK